MYNLPPKLVLVNNTSGVSDLYFLDSSSDQNFYVKPLESTIKNTSLGLLERYFPQNSEVIVFQDELSKLNNNSASKLKPHSKAIEYVVTKPSESGATNTLNAFDSHDLVYIDINYEKLKIYRLSRIDKTDKVKVSVIEQNYLELLTELIRKTDDSVLKSTFFSDTLNSFMNAKAYSIKYRKSGYLLSVVMKNILSDKEVEKKLELKSFAKSNTTNPILVIGGDATKFFSVDMIHLGFSEALLNVLSYNVYSDYSHLINVSMSQDERDRNIFFNTLFEKYILTSYYSRYINLMNDNPLQKIYTAIKVKDGLATKELFGITGTYLKYDFFEEGSVVFEILGNGAKAKVIKNIEYGNLNKSVVVNFINPKQNIEKEIKMKDFLNYISWERNINNQ